MRIAPLTPLENVEDVLTHIVPALAALEARVIEKESPFRSISRIACVKILIGTLLIRLVERLTGARVYVENELRELFFIDARLRRLLGVLIEKGIITSWDAPKNRPDLPPLIRYSIWMQFRGHVSGYVHRVFGSATGYTENGALLPALAEALERYSLYTWNERSIRRSTYVDMRESGAVDPTQFSVFSDEQRKTGELMRRKVEARSEIGWVPARTLSTGKRVYIPAQTVYIVYGNEHKDEAYFENPSSNGGAAGISYEAATYRALCERVERDGLMGFWLTKSVPPRVDLASVPLPRVHAYLDEIIRYGLELHILDITTDIGLPTFTAILIDRYGMMAVSMSAVADYDVPRAFEKLIREILKFPHIPVKETETLNYERVSQIGEDLRSFDERRILWSKQEMIPNIEFLFRGSIKQYSEIVTYPDGHNVEAGLARLRASLIALGHECYIVDVTAPIAKREGLTVVKAVVPTLIPVYFSESEKPLGVKRVYTFPVDIGRAKVPLSPREVNILPHPFV